MNFIQSVTTYFSVNSGYDFYLEVGDMIISQRNAGAPIELKNNKKYLVQSAIAFFIMAGFLFSFFGGFEIFSWNKTLMLSLLFGPFLGVGIVYLLRSRKQTKLVFNLLTQTFKSSSQLFIPFEAFTEFNITTLQSARPRGGGYSYHLNLIYQNQEITLLKDDELNTIVQAGTFISRQTRIRMSDSVEFA